MIWEVATKKIMPRLSECRLFVLPKSEQRSKFLDALSKDYFCFFAIHFLFAKSHVDLREEA